MIASNVDVIELKEYATHRLPHNQLSDVDGELLWRNYSDYVSIDFPSPKTEQNWQFTAKGWVGYIPLHENRGFRLKPKVGLSNLFGMWEYAYRLKSFRFLQSITSCQTLEEFYEQLANILARRILDRGR